MISAAVRVGSGRRYPPCPPPPPGRFSPWPHRFSTFWMSDSTTRRTASLSWSMRLARSSMAVSGLRKERTSFIERSRFTLPVLGSGGDSQ